ncbi:MAG TPA: hypothetical protein PLG47_05335 [Candidatus Dojkabacteria bacterium]|nr:hypothetical protein [Candidatus Dojkabacteria bacterium]
MEKSHFQKLYNTIVPLFEAGVSLEAIYNLYGNALRNETIFTIYLDIKGTIL